uniref:Uncharacterized protein n=1 Tax=Picea sitchensis TaxID=3332 RepID=A9P0S3_PICSI|nr:unknown [Picea sitchensis]
MAVCSGNGRRIWTPHGRYFRFGTKNFSARGQRFDGKSGGENSRSCGRRPV